VARGGDVGRGDAFAKHLLDRIAGHEVNQQKDDRNDEPDDRQHVGKAREEVTEHDVSLVDGG